MKPIQEVQALLLAGLTDDQQAAVRSDRRRVLVVAGAGSGKTEVMARRVAWWIGVEGVAKENIVAFTFTEKAAEEMKFRIRSWMEKISDEHENVTMGGMYIGTIHGFCLVKLRELWADEYHNYDILDETGRASLIHRGYYTVLGLRPLENALGVGLFEVIKRFQDAYDILHEYNLFDIQLPAGDPPINLGQEERQWCERAVLNTNIGASAAAQAFALSAARYYAYIRCRRFLDFSTSQSEFIKRLNSDPAALATIRQAITHLVVDEVQDINAVQNDIMEAIVGQQGNLTAVGDHRQAIYQFRGGRVDIIGNLWEEINNDINGGVVDLRENFRSTPRVINLANEWARTIGQVGNMNSLDMEHGSQQRNDYDRTHIGAKRFTSRTDEAQWIARTINRIAANNETGARHDQRNAEDRGLSRSDIAILLRSSTDARLYMQTLEENGIPAIFRAGPDLFSQPEVLLIAATYAITVGIDQFFGVQPKSLPVRIQNTLGCGPTPPETLRAACAVLRASGIPLAADLEERLSTAAGYIRERISNGTSYSAQQVANFRCSDLKTWLRNTNVMRRVFHQKIYHMLLEEIGVDAWDTVAGRGASALFHLGAFSKMLTSIETPGWTSVTDFPFQVIALLQNGSESGRTEEAPLLVPPDAVTITTIHAAKGLEFPAVFLADVCARRFPSNFAQRQREFPFDGDILRQINVALLADNANYDNERRLMYVAITRAERYLFITASGNQQSAFYRQVSGMVRAVGGIVEPNADAFPANIELLETSYSRDLRLSTSFSDLRYYLACPHDFYLRKVLGFAPTIDQAFGYGRGLHNLLRAVHTDPQHWAALSQQGPQVVEQAIQNLIDRGLFYLRYTTGDPAQNMRMAGLRAVAQYVSDYSAELTNLRFEPEKEFETLIEEEQVLISGAIDVIRLDDPPRVTLIDFKSGNADNENASGLDSEEMRLQVSLYGHAAQHELEYEPEQGLIRYLGEQNPRRRQREIVLTADSIEEARQTAITTARSIKNRQFFTGPNEHNHQRCSTCDFKGFCGLPQAQAFRQNPQN